MEKHITLCLIIIINNLFGSIDEYISGNGLFVVEWAEKGIDVFPEEQLVIKIVHVNENQRKLLISSKGIRGNMLQEHLQNSLV